VQAAAFAGGCGSLWKFQKAKFPQPPTASLGNPKKTGFPQML
jgi:hypothetical protein